MEFNHRGLAQDVKKGHFHKMVLQHFFSAFLLDLQIFVPAIAVYAEQRGAAVRPYYF